MTASTVWPANHTVAMTNRFGKTFTVPVVHVKDLGGGKAEVNVETNYYIEAGHSQPATYATPKSEAKGAYRVSGKTFTVRMTYIYHGIFVRSR